MREEDSSVRKSVHKCDSKGSLVIKLQGAFSRDNRRLGIDTPR